MTYARSQTPNILHPAFLLGNLLALYFLLGRWTFARLEGVYDEGHLWEQPRVWVIALILPLAGLMYYELRERGATRLYTVDIAICVWLVYMLTSALWAPETEHLTAKVSEIGMLLAVAISIALSRSNLTDSRTLLGFWYGVVAAGAAMGILALVMSTGGRVFTPTGGPNIFGRNMGLVGVGALMLATRGNVAGKPFYYALVILSPMWVVMSGSRGALLALGMAGLVLLWTAKTSWATKLVGVAALGCLGTVAFVATDVGRNAAEVFHHRILQQTVEQRYTSSRDDLFMQAVEVGLDSPVLGCGLSGFRAYSWTYPHNIVLETFAEGGLVGVVLLAMMLLAWWRHLARASHNTPGSLLAAMALMITAASFSGNFYDSRGVFLLLALSIAPLSHESTRTLARSSTTYRPPSFEQGASPAGF